jgi:hypothetical protein
MIQLKITPAFYPYWVILRLFLESDVAISVGDGQRGLEGEEASTPDSMTPVRTCCNS